MPLDLPPDPQVWLPPKPAIIRPAPVEEIRFGLSYAESRVEYDRFRLPKDWREASLDELRLFIPSDLRNQPDWIIRAALPGVSPLAVAKALVKTITIVTSTSGSNQTHSVLADWNSADNIIHVIAAGGGGGAGQYSSSAGRGAGAGGAAYSQQTNVSLTPSGSATFFLPVGGAKSTSGSSPGTTGGDCWFNGTTLAGSSLGAKGGTGGGSANNSNSSSNGTGGAAASGIGATKYSGGNGAAANTVVSGGGGGAGGPGGDGNNGVSSTGGIGGGGSGGGVNGGNGSDITTTPSNAGSGGGGNGQTNAAGGNGGLYGAAGAGGARNSSSGTSNGGDGGQGVIVLINNSSL